MNVNIEQEEEFLGSKDDCEDAVIGENDSEVEEESVEEELAESSNLELACMWPIYP